MRWETNLICFAEADVRACEKKCHWRPISVGIFRRMRSLQTYWTHERSSSFSAYIFRIFFAYKIAVRQKPRYRRVRNWKYTRADDFLHLSSCENSAHGICIIGRVKYFLFLVISGGCSSPLNIEDCSLKIPEASRFFSRRVDAGCGFPLVLMPYEYWLQTSLVLSVASF